MQYRNRGQGIQSWDYLETGDYLSADFGGSNQFFFVMQQDGNVCWYKGSGPSDNRGHVWCAFTTAPGDGDYCLGLSGDGNLIVFKGKTPKGSTGKVWQTDATGAEGTYYLAICSRINPLDESTAPAVGVFTSNPTVSNAPALWIQKSTFSL